MKKMQELQPDMNRIREKFKDDPQKLQMETMALFKRTGTSPFGGCLPILLQTPIFLAFYQVLSNAVELVGAPFYGWISDLSVRDPYYVFPIIMIVTMFLQQKMTPTTTADPTQQKVMMFMPLIFGFLMKDQAAGLTIYFTFSLMLGILQQMLVFKSTKK